MDPGNCKKIFTGAVINFLSSLKSALLVSRVQFCWHFGHYCSLVWLIMSFCRSKDILTLSQETLHLTPQSIADMFIMQLISRTSAHLYLKCCGWILDTILKSFFCITYTLRTVPLAETKANKGFQLPSLQWMVSRLLTDCSVLLFILLLQQDLIWAYALSIIYWILCP